MDDDTLQSLWETTIGERADAADPDTTYRPGANSGQSGATPAPLALPSFSMEEALGSDLTVASQPAEAGEQDVNATTIAGEGGGQGHDESAVPTLVQSGPQTTAGEPGEAAPQGPPSPSYELREVLGAGGMGVVYRARQQSLRRDVALKKVLAKRSGERWRAKFVGEAHVTGQLAHPNIVPVYDLGQGPDGEAVLAMKLVDGITWKRLLNPKTDAEQVLAEGYALEDHLRIFDQVCNAVSFAHSRELVHLDLKPENVLIGEFGEVLVMDWGLALSISAEPDDSRIPHRSQLVAPCGTPSYMAPELARGAGETVGPWTDVYLLGAILCELLTGKPPHKGGSIRKVITRAVYGKPPTFGVSTPLELREACLRALAKPPAERYQTVAELQNAVRDYLSHRESRLISDAARELLARSQASAGGEINADTRDALYADFAAAVAGFAHARLLWDGNEDARAGEWSARLAYAQAALAQDDLGLAASLARALEPRDPGAEALQRVLVAQVAARARERDDAARSARLLRLGLGAALALLVAGLATGTALIGAARDRAEAARGEAEDARAAAEEARAAAVRDRAVAEHRLAGSLVDQGGVLGASGRWAEARARFAEARRTWTALGASTIDAELGELAADQHSPRPLLELKAHDGPAAAVAFGGPSGEAEAELLSVGADGSLVVFDVAGGTALATLASGQGVLTDVTVSRDGRRWATAGSNGTVCVWDAKTRAITHTLKGHSGSVLRVAFSPEGTRLLSTGSDTTVRVWNPATGEVVSVCEGHTEPVVAAAWRTEGWAFTATASGELLWWNAGHGSVHWRYRDRVEGGVSDLGFRPAGPQLVFASPDHTVKVWEFDESRNNYAPRETWRGHTGSVVALAYTPDGTHAVSVGHDAKLNVWTADLGEAEGPGRGLFQSAPARDVALGWDGAFVATAGQDGVVRVWDLGLARREPTGAQRESSLESLAAGEAETFTSGAIDPRWELVATGSAEGRITLWHLGSARRLRDLDWHEAAIVHVAFAPTHELLSVSVDGQVRAWTLDGFTPLATFDAGVRVSGVAPWERGVVLGTESGQVVVLERAGAEWVKRREWTAHPDAVAALAVHGGQVWTAGAQSEVREWTVATGAPGRTLKADHPLRALSIAPSDGARGETLIGGDGQGGVYRWSLGVAEARPQALGARHADAVTDVEVLGEGLIASAGRDRRWRLIDRRDARELQAFDGPGSVVALAPLAGGRGVLVVRPRSVQRVAFDASSRQSALAASAEGARADPGPSAWAEQGRWFASRGSHRTAVVLLERARAGGVSGVDPQLAWSLWRLERYAAAAAAFERVAEHYPAFYARLVREALAAAEDLSGSRLGQAPDRVHCVAFTPDGQRVVTSSDGGDLRVWDVSSGALLKVLRGHAYGVLAFALSPDGETVVSGDRRGGVRVWDLTRGEPPRSIQAGSASVGVVALTPDGEGAVLASGGKLQRLALQGGALTPLAEFRSSPNALAISADGTRLVVGVREELILLKLPSGAELARAQPKDGSVIGAAYLPDGRLLSASSRNHGLTVWSPDLSTPTRSLAFQRDGTYGFGLSADGTRAVTAGSGGSVVVHDVVSLEPLAVWTFERVWLAAAIDARGSRVLLGGRRGHLRLRSVPR